jgi:hypothetical protein
MKNGILVPLAWLFASTLAIGQAPAPLSAPEVQPGGPVASGPPGQVEIIPAPVPLAPAPPPFGSGAPTPPPFGSGAPTPPPFGSGLPLYDPYGGPGPLPLPVWTPDSIVGPQRAWLQTELLIWWISPGPNPTPLATNGNVNDANPGAFGQPGTTAILLGARDLNFDATAGFRLAGGYWFGDQRRWGIDGSFFVLGEQTVHRRLSSDDNGNPGIYRPVNDVNIGETSLFVAVPGMAAGVMSESASSQLIGFEVNGAYRLLQRRDWNLNVLGGFRFLDLRETININTFTDDFAGVLTGPANPGGAAEAAGSTLSISDSFRTSNQFYGGQIGLQTTWAFAPRWYLSGRLQTAFGDSHQAININGLTVQDQPGVGVTTAPAGVLALASNSGHFTHDAFSVVPEGQLRVGWQLAPYLSTYLGYNFLYWSNVVRPGSTISRTVDVQGIPTWGAYNPSIPPAAPAHPAFVQSGFWAQGISFGLQFNY